MFEPPTESGFALLGDHPETGPDDALGFDRVAEQLADMLLASEAVGPFTLGIEAGWGMGKSSLMRRRNRWSSSSTTGTHDGSSGSSTGSYSSTASTREPVS